MINYWNLLLAPINVFQAFFEQKKDYGLANVSNVEFLEKFPNAKNLRIGTSWSTEEFLGLTKFDSDQDADVKVFDALDFLINDLKIRDIRLRLIWSNIESGKNQIKIPELDIKIINYLISKKINICLNIGPLKCFRYPEMHLPQRVFDLFSTPKEKEFLMDLENPIAKESLIYLENLCKEIRKTFDSKKFDQYVKAIQLDNEPKSRFGLNKWLLGDNYMIKTFLIAQKYFPNQKFLINSPFVPFDWTEILEPDLQLCLNLINKLPKEIKQKIILGLNFYNYVPYIPKILFANVYPDNYSAMEAMYGKFQNILKNLNFDFEVTESQFEQWGDNYPFNLPGNSAEHLRYSLLRHLNLINKNYGKTVIRLWGIERFIVKQKENREIVELVREINDD